MRTLPVVRATKASYMRDDGIIVLYCYDAKGREITHLRTLLDPSTIDTRRDQIHLYSEMIMQEILLDYGYTPGEQSDGTG